MTELLMIAVFFIFVLWQVWVGYVAIMHLRRIRKKYGLTLSQKIFGYPALFVYFTLDVFLRLTLVPLLFLRLPKLETVSALLERESKGSGWRKNLADYFREDLLADFDPTGSHGKPGR